jgi:amino acid transporter
MSPTVREQIASGGSPEDVYAGLPWKNRGDVMSLLLVGTVVGSLASFFLQESVVVLAALLSLASIVMITIVAVCALFGTVVNKPKPDQGGLTRWSHANKVAAVIVLLSVLWWFVSVLRSVVEAQG